MKKKYKRIIRKKTSHKKIHLICFTFDDDKIELKEYEKIFYRFFINLCNLKDKLLFLISKNENNANKIYIYTIHQFLNSNNYFMKEKEILNPEYIAVNNKIIFENNKDKWNELKEKMKIIKNKI